MTKLDSARHCLHRMSAGGGAYLCRNPTGHDGAHNYLPVDLVIVAEPPPASLAPMAQPAPVRH